MKLFAGSRSGSPPGRQGKLASRAGSGSERPDELVREVAVDERHDHSIGPAQFDVAQRAASVSADLVRDAQHAALDDITDRYLGLVGPGAGAVLLPSDEVFCALGHDGLSRAGELFARYGVHGILLTLGNSGVERM